MLPSTNELKKQVWKIQTSPKIKNFLWKAQNDAIHVVDLIAKRGIKIDSRCQICGREGESVNHVLFLVLWQDKFGHYLAFLLLRVDFYSSALFSNFSFLFKVLKTISITLVIRRYFPWLLWYI